MVCISRGSSPDSPHLRLHPRHRAGSPNVPRGNLFNPDKLFRGQVLIEQTVRVTKVIEVVGGASTAAELQQALANTTFVVEDLWLPLTGQASKRLLAAAHLWSP